MTRLAAAARTPLRPLLPLYLVILVGFTGYGMMVTLFTQMLVQHEGPLLPPSASTGYRTQVLGLLLALYPAGQFFGTPVLSSLSDRFGRRAVLLHSLAATTACYALVAGSLALGSLALLAASLLLCGIGEANVAIAQSAIADVSAAADRGRLFGYIFVMVRLGYVIGPLLGGQVYVLTGAYAAPFWMMVGLLGCAWVWTYLQLRETHAPEVGQPVRFRAALTSLAAIVTDRSLRPIYLVNFLIYLAIFGFSRTILIYLVDQLHMNAREITAYYAYFAAAVFVADLWLMPWMSARMSLRQIAVLTALLGGLTTILMPLPHSPVWFWVILGPSSCLLSVCLAAVAAVLSESADAARQGRVMGNNEALEVGGQAAGAAGGGFLASASVTLPFYAFGGLVILGALLLTRFRSPPPTAPAHP